MIYLTGYQLWKPEELDAEVLRLKATLVDIRYKAFSRAQEWMPYAFLNRLGVLHYVKVPQLGNVNYKNGGPIKLADETVGIAAVEALLKRGPAILMCGCWDAKTCHRTHAGRVLEALGHQVQELPKIKTEKPAKPKPPPLSGGGMSQGSLF